MIKAEKKAQSTLEYAALVVCVAAAIISMAVYFKRAVNGSLRSSLGEISRPFDPRSRYHDITTNYYGEVSAVNYIKPTTMDLDDDPLTPWSWMLERQTRTLSQQSKSGHEGFE